MKGHSLQRLKVVGIRYRTAEPAPDDERGLDAYATSGVYGMAGVPFDVVEPRLCEKPPVPDDTPSDEARRVGLLNGQIADAVAEGRRAGASILMTGGNCAHITGVLGGLQDVHGPGLRLGLVWFDAHGDFNTPRTSPSGSLGGMPVAVAAGLAHPEWRELSHMVSPLPTNRIVLVGARSLDPAEAALIRASDAALAAPAPGFPGASLAAEIDRLSTTCDALYLHIDADILDQGLVPSHGTKEPNGPDIEQTLAAIDRVMATGKVVALALVSIYNRGEAGHRSMTSGIELLRMGLRSWSLHGTARI